MTTTLPDYAITPAPPAVPILQLTGINKSFGAVQVLRDVDFTAQAGKVTALVGDNGAGKSTLIKGIAGIYPFDSGDYLFEGDRVHITHPKQANALGIEVVYQDLALCDNLDIVQNLYLGRESLSGPILDEITMEERAKATLAGLSVRTVKSIRQKVASLSGGQRQTVAIARAVLWNSKVVILDEPTAALGVAQTEQVLNLVRRLADNGLAVILISHNMNDVLAVADEIAVLYLGRLTAQVHARDVTHTEVVQLITGGALVQSGGGVTVEEPQLLQDLRSGAVSTGPIAARAFPADDTGSAADEGPAADPTAPGGTS
jgi:D-xylose transport system ATP-binding protein